jgi:hypothetical protein
MHAQVEMKLASVRQGNDAELEHSGHDAQQRLAKAATALLVRGCTEKRWHGRVQLLGCLGCEAFMIIVSSCCNTRVMNTRQWLRNNCAACGWAAAGFPCSPAPCPYASLCHKAHMALDELCRKRWSVWRAVASGIHGRV